MSSRWPTSDRQRPSPKRPRSLGAVAQLLRLRLHVALVALAPLTAGAPWAVRPAEEVALATTLRPATLSAAPRSPGSSQCPGRGAPGAAASRPCCSRRPGRRAPTAAARQQGGSAWRPSAVPWCGANPRRPRAAEGAAAAGQPEDLPGIRPQKPAETTEHLSIPILNVS